MSEHIVPVRVYLTIFLVLLVGTTLTVLAAFHDFTYHIGSREINLNTIIAMTIAITKATFVVLYFMHVRYHSKLVWIFAGAGFLWLLILFTLTLADYTTRS